ncbi:MAG TPA: lysylphosphatidylglycerol synthase transmembrane domain-containing protein [Bacteroidales bacterium]|nr:lysylphosphatidylglycerol synthase transmembrane domain-containing protein [Bacteroidales bacterium]HRZ76046.1 lysylphosphatidylglycerol synthase transmembrane domain-containing protein [Bacteroidales bacterium]
MNKRLLSAAKLLFFLGLGALFIWLFLRKLSPEQQAEIWDSFWGANYWWALLAIVLGVLSHLVRAMRWMILLKPMGYRPRLINSFSCVMVGYFANLALPRLGEVTRCTALARYEKVPFEKSFGTVIVERVIDLVIFGGLFLLTLVLQWGRIKDYVYDKIWMPLSERFQFLQDGAALWLILLGSLVALSAFLYLIRKRFAHFRLYQKLRGLILGLIEGLISIARIERPFLFIFQSLLIWGLYYLMIYLCFFSFPGTSGLGPEAGLAMLVFGSIGIMIVQGGIGIYPAIIAEVTSIYGVAATTGYALGWLAWTAQTLMIILAGLAAVLLLPVINRNHVQNA